MQLQQKIITSRTTRITKTTNGLIIAAKLQIKLGRIINETILIIK